MSESFDPYLKWLGIRKDSSVINHYRLLGLEQFESDVDVISNAAERQIRHIETFAVGNYSDMGKQIIAEVRAARDCLLNPEMRENYNRGLDIGRAPASASPPIQSVVERHNFQVGSPSSEPNVGVIPNVKSHRRRKSKSGTIDLIGWVLGAIGAFVFAYVLLNTDLIETIKGTKKDGKVDHEKLVDKPMAIPRVAKNSAAAKRPARNSRRPTSRKPAGSATPKTASAPPKNRQHIRAANNPTKNVPANLPVPAAKPVPKPLARVPVPEAKLVDGAVAKLRSAYKTQFAADQPKAKADLATALLDQHRGDQLPEMSFALLDTASKVAAEAGDMETVVDAIDRMKNRFEIDYWSELKPHVLKVLTGKPNFENISEDLDMMLHEAREDEAHEFCFDVASQSAKLARKWGDKVQIEMLSNFARDMKSLMEVKRDFDELVVGNEPLSRRDHLVKGKYLCYSKMDWEQGLNHLAKGSDSALASVAKTDLESKEKDQTLVINEWLVLCSKPKYKGLDRRCIFEHIDKKLKSGLPANKTREIEKIIMSNNQVVKRYVDDSRARLRTANFGIVRVGNSGPFGPVSFERGSYLKIGNSSRQRLRLKKEGLEYRAESGRLKFFIRFMNNGVAEMRILDSPTGKFTIWYEN